MRYYRVLMPRGHVGIGNEALIDFNIAAKDACTAMRIAQRMPGVKHSKFPLRCEQISKADFAKRRKENAYVKAMAK